MSNNHGEKYFSKLLFGFGFVTAAVFLHYYSSSVKLWKNDWYFWGLGTAILLNIGLYLLVSAAVHKMKNDMIQRQKARDVQKSNRDDA